MQCSKWWSKKNGLTDEKLTHLVAAMEYKICEVRGYRSGQAGFYGSSWLELYIPSLGLRLSGAPPAGAATSHYKVYKLRAHNGLKHLHLASCNI